MTPLLHLNDVSRFYGALKAVDGVSVTVAAGEALGVIGPNGAGKTTMFNLITGDVPHHVGQIVFAGTDITAAAATCALAARYRPLLPNPAPFRDYERVREPAGRRDLRRPVHRSETATRPAAIC